MTDEELRKTAKGNTYVPDVWVTHHDTDWGPHLWSANIVPWDEDYDAPITGWADNTHFVNADRIVAAEARIEALTEQLKTVLDREAATTARYDAKTDELEAKLAECEARLGKAMEVVRDAVDAWDNHNKTGDMMQGHWVTDARATLAEIGGEKG